MSREFFECSRALKTLGLVAFFFVCILFCAMDLKLVNITYGYS